MFDTLLTSIINNLITPAESLIFALAVIYFLWGVFVFIKNADSAEKRKEGFNHIVWGIVGMAIMISAKGIINIIIYSLGIN